MEEKSPSAAQVQQPADTVLQVAPGTANDAATQFPEQGRGRGDPVQLWRAPNHDLTPTCAPLPGIY